MGRLYTIPPPTGPHQESDLNGMDSRPSIGSDHAAHRWRHRRQVDIEMGSAETLHAVGLRRRRSMPAGSGLDIGDCGLLHARSEECESALTEY